MYQIQLKGPRNPGRKPLYRTELEDFAQKASRDFNTQIVIQYETQGADKVTFSTTGKRTYTPLPNTESAMVDIRTSQQPPERQLPPLEDIDLYGQQPPKNADEAFNRFIEEKGVDSRKLG